MDIRSNISCVWIATSWTIISTIATNAASSPPTRGSSLTISLSRDRMNQLPSIVIHCVDQPKKVSMYYLYPRYKSSIILEKIILILSNIVSCYSSLKFNSVTKFISIVVNHKILNQGKKSNLCDNQFQYIKFNNIQISRSHIPRIRKFSYS